MTTLQTPTVAGRGPDANWAGWAGYAPTARGPEARRARAQAAGILEPAPAALAAGAGPAAQLEVVELGAEPPVRCTGRARGADSSRLAAIRARKRLMASA
ncbi:MAG: hypothetical protein J7513_18015 [Solirubrobacteraceae bacterium]|nr:hypothetical protein [Solirubrobacteraceae bacterium]